MHDKFLILINKHNENLQKFNSTFSIIGYAKLMLVVFVGLAVFLMFRSNFALWYVFLLISSLVISGTLWIYHAKLSNKIDYLKGIIAIYNQHISRLNGQWVNFKDIGAEFIDSNHPYACDLDIVGKKSLFQYLNTTHTWHGRQAFANDLLHPIYERPELEKRQEAIKELSQDIEFSCEAQYYISKIGIDPAMPNLIACITDSTAFSKNKAYKFILTCIPILTLLFIIGIFIFQQRQLYIVGAIAAAVQFIIWALGASKAHVYLGTIAKLPYKLSAYSEVINILTRRKYSATKLSQIQKKLKEAEDAIKDLSKIADKISLQHNVILYFMANTLLLWDYYCAFLLQDWKQKYAHLAEDWFLAIGEFESMLCLSHLPSVCNNVCLPVIDEKKRIFDAKSIGHPLLPNEDRVNNDLHFHDNIFIVSGSNMSGKTTFLRTIGVNIVLARTGGFVCAEEMRLANFSIATSMRLSDDLNNGVSTFYAELTRIKMIIDLAKTQPHLIFMIDEIFRGTNSVDRLAGAKGVIAKLNALDAVGLLSTHDLELCELENTFGRIRNYSFSETYEDSNLSFDYKLKTGKSYTTNAMYLMKMIGIDA